MKWLSLPLLALLSNVATAFEKMNCFGTEPFWDAIITDNQITFKLESTKIYS
jgi:uncharacterized membrane protein